MSITSPFHATTRSLLALSIAVGAAGLTSCGSDSDPDTQTQVGCAAAELVVSVVAGRFEINLPQGLDDACVAAVHAYQAGQATLPIEFDNGFLYTLPTLPGPGTNLPNLDAILADLDAGGVRIGS